MDAAHNFVIDSMYYLYLTDHARHPSVYVKVVYRALGDLDWLPQAVRRVDFPSSQNSFRVFVNVIAPQTAAQFYQEPAVFVR